jgi:hypothetical protein
MIPPRKGVSQHMAKKKGTKKKATKKKGGKKKK